MKRLVLGAAMGAMLVGVGVWCGLGATAGAQSRPEARPAAGSPLVTLSLAGADKIPRLAVVDPGERRLAVYEIAENGQITLKSVRNLTWDMSLEQFNVGAPTPDEIRALLPR